MRAMLLMAVTTTVAACGAGASGKGRLRVEAVAGDAPWLTLGPGPADDRLMFEAASRTISRVGAGGEVRWQLPLPGPMVQVVQPGAELWFQVKGETWGGDLLRIDARSGAELGRVKATRSLGSWLQRGGALYHVDSSEVARVDPATGQDLWSVKGGFVAYDAQVGERALWVRCDGGVCGFAAATGAAIATLPHANWPMLTPDGATLVLQEADGAGVYDAATGALRWKAPAANAGTMVNKTAVSDAWLAVLSSGRRDDETDWVQVFAIAGGAPVWSVSSAKGKYLEYLAAGGDLVVWYDSGDAGIHAVRLPDGARAKVDQLHEAFVLSTDASGMAPAVPDGAPQVDGEVVTVTRFGNARRFRVH